MEPGLVPAILLGLVLPVAIGLFAAWRAKRTNTGAARQLEGANQQITMTRP